MFLLKSRHGYGDFLGTGKIGDGRDNPQVRSAAQGNVPSVTLSRSEILQLPMEKRAEMAFREAVEEVLDEHVRLNLPIYISRGGKVVELSPQEILELRASDSGTGKR